jgi:hypothetical protein
MTELERSVIWTGEQMTATQRRSAKASADREVHQIIDPTPRAKRALAQNRHLGVVLKEDGEFERCADRPSKIRTRKVWSKVRWLYGDARPGIQRTRSTDPNPHEARNGARIFTRGVRARKLQRGDAGSDNRCGPIGGGGWCRSTTEPCAVCAHECGAHLRATKIEREHRCVGGRLRHELSVHSPCG